MMLGHKRLVAFLAVVTSLGVLVAACGGGAEPTATPRPTATATPTAAPPTPTTAPTVAAPEATPAPTSAVPLPTPTAGPAPTATPTPTAVPKAGLQAQLAGPGVESFRYVANAPDLTLPPKSGGVLKMSTNNDLTSLDRIGQQQVSTDEVAGIVYNRLVRCAMGVEMKRYSPTSCELIPELAERWQISSDGKVYTFSMRRGVKFQNIPPVNGRELTAEDPAWTFNQFLQSPNHRAYAEWVGSTEKVEALDRDTLRITLKEPNGFFLSTVVGHFSSSIIPPELQPEMAKKAIGTGPFTVKEIVPGARWILARNAGYWRRDDAGRQLPYLDSIESQYIPNLSAARAAFRTGKLHWASPGNSTSTVAERDAFRKELPQYPLYEWTSPNGGIYLGLRNDEKPFDDVRVRRAFSMSVDRAAILQAISGGLGYYQNTVPWVYALDNPPALKDLGPYYQYNPAEAKRLLEEAGLKTPAKFVYETSDATPAWLIHSQLWQQQAKAAGLEIELSATDAPRWFERYFQWRLGQRRGVVEMMSILIKFNAWGEVNLEMHSRTNPNGINDPVLDALLEKAFVEVDEAKRKQVYRQVWEREKEQVYRPVVVPNTPTWTFVSPALHNWLFNQWYGLTNIHGKPEEILWLD